MEQEERTGYSRVTQYLSLGISGNPMRERGTARIPRLRIGLPLQTRDIDCRYQPE